MKKTRKKFRLRLDLLEHVTSEDLMESALANLSRYKPEHLLAKTGIVYLRSATPEEREEEGGVSQSMGKNGEKITRLRPPGGASCGSEAAPLLVLLRGRGRWVGQRRMGRGALGAEGQEGPVIGRMGSGSISGRSRKRPPWREEKVVGPV